MEFEWDEDKRRANIEKHGIDFVRATTMWLNPVVDPAESRTVAGETRFLALGIIGDDELIIATIYTERGDAKRLISARRARRNERRYYQDQHDRGG
jgi:uncharacterized DUF497 family protein